MKPKKIIILIVALIISIGVFYFLDTRIWINTYEIKDETLLFESNDYFRKDSLSESDSNNLGQKIGIAVNGKRSLTDYIWPNWIFEYKDDKNHNHVFVKGGLMEMGSVYTKQTD
jgi:hypothetical protein